MTISDKITLWKASGTTGASAKCIASHIGGDGKADGSYPRDAGDFGRCERLLDMVPELRSEFHRMAEVNPYWAALVPEWANIKASKDQFATIQKITRPIENNDKSIFRIKGGTFRFFEDV